MFSRTFFSASGFCCQTAGWLSKQFLFLFFCCAVLTFGHDFPDNNSVARRESHGAQHSGRGGAGNFFHKGDDTEQASLKHAANTSAVDDKPEGLAAKGKALLLGKKEKSPPRN